MTNYAHLNILNAHTTKPQTNNEIQQTKQFMSGLNFPTSNFLRWVVVFTTLIRLKRMSGRNRFFPAKTQLWIQQTTQFMSGF